MKTLYMLLALCATSTVFATEYRQCVVDFPNGTIPGICKTDSNTPYIKFYTCQGEQLAFIAPGSLDVTYIETCCSKYKGFPGVGK